MANQNRQLRLIEAEGFHHGVHEVDPTPAEREIEAVFCREVHRVRHDAIEDIARHEGLVGVLELRQPEVTSHWLRRDAETNGLRPAVAMPCVAVAAAALAVAGETLLLAPVMDGFGIAEPVWQWLTAGTLVLVASGLVHMSVQRTQRMLRSEAEEARDGAEPRSGAFVTATLALFALATLTTLAWWRATEMIFAAGAESAEWARFLEGNQLLTKACVTLLTLGLPLFAAVCVDWGAEGLRYGAEWRRARREHTKVLTELERTRKALAALVGRRDERIEVLTQERVTWLESYRENYQLGVRIGAKRAPVWHLVLRVVSSVFAVSAICVGCDPWLRNVMPETRYYFYACVIGGLGGWLAYRAIKAWERPSPMQLYRDREVAWRGGAAAPLSDRQRSITDRGALTGSERVQEEA